MNYYGQQPNPYSTPNPYGFSLFLQLWGICWVVVSEIAFLRVTLLTFVYPSVPRVFHVMLSRGGENNFITWVCAEAHTFPFKRI